MYASLLWVLACTSVFPYNSVCVQLGCRSSIRTLNIVLLWCKKGCCLEEGEAIMAPLWIMRQECDPYFKVNVSSCPCRSPSLHRSLLYYRWWPWQHLIANNIHLNKPFHLPKSLPNLFPLKKKVKKISGGRWILFQNKWKCLKQMSRYPWKRCFRPDITDLCQVKNSLTNGDSVSTSVHPLKLTDAPARPSHDQFKITYCSSKMQPH